MISITLINRIYFFFKVFILGITSVFLCSNLIAQDNDKSVVTNQLWLDFNPTWKISERFDLRGKVGAKAIYPSEWYKFYTTAEISYWIPKFRFKKARYDERVYFGCDFYSIYYAEQANVIEISPYQGYTQTWPKTKRFLMMHNFELGQRFQWDTQEWNYSFGLKVSYEASIIYKFHGEAWKYGKGFFLSASAKFWWNLIETNVFNDVLRITPGIGYQINPQWKTAFYIGYNYTRNLSIDNFHSDNIIYRIRLYYSIPNTGNTNKK